MEALLGRAVPPESLAEAGDVQIRWEHHGAGPPLGAGRDVKGEVAATTTVGGRELALERCHLHGRIGRGSWVPAIEVCSTAARDPCAQRTQIPSGGELMGVGVGSSFGIFGLPHSRIRSTNR